MNRASARKAVAVYLEAPVAGLLARTGVSPNLLTLLGLSVAGASAYAIGVGQLWLGGVLVLTAGVFDLFDGALARATGRASRFGALLDSTADRISEAAVLLGLLVFFALDESVEGVVLVYLALVGSLMVSYLRARAEGLGIECRVGLMTRPERVATIGGALIVGHWAEIAVLVALGVVAGLTTFTTGHRLFHAWRALGDGE
jgi:CDP-diacylglycerol--glycerol-3-phosphate 3-phosphatidyltransferase